MPYLHYGSELTIELDTTAMKRVMESVGAHATRGGWVIVRDQAGHEWSLLVTAGIPIWLSESE